MATEQELRDYLRKATALLQETKQRLREEQEARRQPIAIVSMACRAPGHVETPDALWALLEKGESAISMPPAHRRWDVVGLYDRDPDQAGKAYSLLGGFLHGADAFDAPFFELNEHEATLMDPQHRLLLEVCWEALERAGIPSSSFAGSRTGVFVGVMENGYAGRFQASASAGADDRNVSLGSRASLASARVAYALGLRGPAVSLDTACSSSLVSLHLACQALRAGECELALAGGVTVLASPGLFVESSRQRGLAADGRCKPFSDAADGIVWAEGAGMIALERLEDARRNGHPVLGLVRGSALNHDGRGQGLTAPNGTAQREVIADALRASGLEASDVDVVEAHGTGTPMGDSIEATALLETYGRAHTPDRPLWIGNLKPSVGHAQAAAGILGVIKTILAMQHAQLPGMGSLGTPNRHVDWSRGAARLLEATRAWEKGDGPRRAGVSAFGVGTNAHVILEEAPDEARASESSATTVTLLVSGKTEKALHDQAGRMADHLERRPDDLFDVAWSAAQHRTQFRHRGAVVASDRVGAIAALRDLASGTSSERVACDVDREQSRPVMIFTAEGGSLEGVGAILETEPVFAKAIDACVAALTPHLGEAPSPRVVLCASADERARALQRPDVARAVAFATSIALAELWKAWGVLPAAVVGVRVGAIAGAWVAGALTLDQAARDVVRGIDLDLRTASKAAIVPFIATTDEGLVRSIDELKSAGHAIFHVVGREPLHVATAALAVQGIAVDWPAVWKRRGRFVPLPTYAFQRSHYWLYAPASPSTSPAPPHATTGDRPIRAGLHGMSDADRGRFLVALVRKEVAAVLGLPEGDAVAVDRSLFQMGVDSLRATSLRNRLKALTGSPLPATLVFENPTVEAIATLLSRELAGQPSATSQGLAVSRADSDEERSGAAVAAPTYEEFDL